MKDHYVRVPVGKDSLFSTPAMSLLYILLGENQLMTRNVWEDRYYAYLLQKPSEAKELPTSSIDIARQIEALLAEGFVHCINGQRLLINI